MLVIINLGGPFTKHRQECLCYLLRNLVGGLGQG